MIESKDNEKLKLVRKLARRRDREREGLFVTEGEDLLAAGRAAGAEPRFVLVAAASGIDGEEVTPEILAGVSALGSGTRVIAVWPERWAGAVEGVALYLHGLADPSNVGAIVRSAHALIDATVVIGPETADPFGPRAVRASMGSVFGQPLLRAGIDSTPRPRAALVAHGGAGLDALAGARTVCIGAERAGLPPEVLAECDSEATIPLRPQGAESLNVAAAAAIACQRLSSPLIAKDGAELA